MATLKANMNGVIKGKFKIPAKIPAGSKRVEFQGAGGTSGSAVFVGQGSLTVTTLRQVQSQIYYIYEPVAQTFTLTGAAQICAIDLWFVQKSTQVRVQLRDTENGYPGQRCLAEAILNPDRILVDGNPSRASFPCPVSLEAGTEYCFVVLCDDPDTRILVAQLGEYDETAQQRVTQQPYTVGLMFTSSNARAWTAHQDQDITFRLLRASYSPLVRELNLGTVQLQGATDLLLMALAEEPSAQTRVEYLLTLPDGAKLTVASGQPVRLAQPVSGTARVSAKLAGTAQASPVFYPGTQIISGAVQQSADYYTRSVVAIGARKATLIYEAVIPSGSSVTPRIQIDNGAWQPLTAAGTTTGDEGSVEFRFTKDLAGNNLIKVKFTLEGTSAARPRVRNIRLLATA